MTQANLVMLGLGLISFAVGLVLLLRRGGSEASIYARRIAGMMLAALGMFLTIFAFGLSGGARSFPDA
jgi:hypothetical protein